MEGAVNTREERKAMAMGIRVLLEQTRDQKKERQKERDRNVKRVTIDS